MREYRGNSTGDEVVVGGDPDTHGRWTAPQDCVIFGAIKDGVKKGRAGKSKSRWHAWKATSGLSNPTKLETRSPRCPELDRNSHRWRAEVYDRVEEEEKSNFHRERRTAK